MFADARNQSRNIKISSIRQGSETVENFVGLAKGTKEWTDPASGKKEKKPLYNGTVFHRVIKGFMIQGGDPLGKGTGGPGYHSKTNSAPTFTSLRQEFWPWQMQDPDHGSQFFITLAATPWLDGKHTIFGEVVDGMPVVEKIGVIRPARWINPLIP